MVTRCVALFIMLEMDFTLGKQSFIVKRRITEAKNKNNKK